MKRHAVTALAFSSLLACASLVGLDDSDPPGGSSGGTTSGSGSSSGTGTLTQDGITISPADIGLPSVKCGEKPTGTITLSNESSTEDQPYEATLTGSDTFSIKSGASGTVKAGGSVSIVIEENATKPGTSAAELSIKTRSTTQGVHVTGQVQGATLSVTPQVADFGFVKENNVSAPINAIFANDGNKAITVTGFTGDASKSDFALPATVVVPPNGTFSAPITMNGGAASDQPVTANVTPVVDDPALLCGATLPPLKLTGQRVKDDVLVNPASADFGTADCNGTTGTKQPITISNFSTSSSAEFSTSLQAGTRFKVTPDKGTIPNSSDGKAKTASLTIEVVNAGDTPGDISETLTVAIGAPFNKSYDVKLTIGVIGALIQVDPANLGTIATGANKSFTVSNAGNALVCVSYGIDKPDFSVSGTGSLFPGFDGSGKVSFTTTVAGDQTGTVTIRHESCFPVKSAAFCKPPPTVTVTGHKD